MDVVGSYFCYTYKNLQHIFSQTNNLRVQRKINRLQRAVNRPGKKKTPYNAYHDNFALCIPHAANLALKRLFSVSPSSANFLIPSCSLSDAIASCNSTHRNSDSLSTYDTFASCRASGESTHPECKTLLGGLRSRGEERQTNYSIQLLECGSVNFLSSSRRRL